MDVSGVIIAGGRSTRFGERDKSIAPLAGVPMIRRVADQLHPLIDEVVINCRIDQREEIEGVLEGYSKPVSMALDRSPDSGPLPGIHEGMVAASAPWAIVVACDMPFIDDQVVAFLLTQRSSEIEAIVPEVGEWLQPTHAIYETEAMEQASQEAYEAGDGRIVSALEQLSVLTIPETELRKHGSLKSFDNINTAADFAEAETYFERTK